MSDRYWVGGTANWDATAGTKWSTTSGGAGGSSVPTSSDNVFLDASSGAVTVTISAAANCANLTCTGYTGTLAGSLDISVYGSLVLGSGMTRTFTGNLFFLANGTGKTITCNGKTLNSDITFQALDDTYGWVFQDAFVNSSTKDIFVSKGVFNTNNQTFTIGPFYSNDFIGGARTLTLGSSTMNVSAWITSDVSQLTFNKGTSTIVLRSTHIGHLFQGGGLTYNSVSGVMDSVSDAIGVSGANTFSDFTISSSNTSSTNTRSWLYFFDNQTITGTFSVSGNASTRRLTVYGIDATGLVFTQKTITAGAVSLSNVNLRDIVQAGASIPWTGTSVNYLPDAVGTTSEWTNPNNVFEEEGTYSLGGTGSTVDEQNYKQFNIPTFTGYGIDGIDVIVKARDTASSPTTWTLSARLSWDGGTNWSSAKTQTWSETSGTVKSLGSSTELWGRTWAASELTNNNFQIAFDVTGGVSTTDFEVDHVRVQVYISSGTTTSTSSSTSTTSSSTSSTSTSSTSSSSTSTTSSSTSSTSSSSSSSSSSTSITTSSTSISTSTTSSSSSTTTTSSSSTSSTSSSSSTTSTSSSSSSTSTTSSSSSTSTTMTLTSTSTTTTSTSTTSSSTTTTSSSSSSSSTSTTTTSSSSSSSSSSTSTIMYIPDINMVDDRKPETATVQYN